MSSCFRLSTSLRCFSSASSGANKYAERFIPKRILKASEQSPNFEAQEKVEQISEAVHKYLVNYQANVDFFEKKTQEFELGKRHLANIMGYDPEKLTPEQIEVSLSSKSLRTSANALSSIRPLTTRSNRTQSSICFQLACSSDRHVP